MEYWVKTQKIFCLKLVLNCCNIPITQRSDVFLTLGGPFGLRFAHQSRGEFKILLYLE
jgi:hypothetical protein